MNRQKDLSDRLKRLNCHFNWNLDTTSSSNNINCDVLTLEDKLRCEIQGNPPIACNAYLLLAFAFTVGDVHKAVDYAKAMTFIETASAHAQSYADKYLVTANKLWILNAKRDTGQNQKLLSVLNDLEDALTDTDRSDICVAEAYSLSRFTIAGHERALDKYKQARALHPGNAEAHFGVGLVLGRLRRAKHGQVCKASEEELEAFKKCMELWPDNPLPFVFYALALSDRLQNQLLARKTMQEMDRYMTLAMSKAMVLCSGSGIVFKWCKKGYKRICCSGITMSKKQYLQYVTKQKQCIDKAVELSPNDTSILHEAGLFYWRVRQLKDLDKAETYLIKAVDCSLFQRNFWADMDLVRLRTVKRDGYDVLEAYSALETKFASKSEFLPMLYECIALGYENRGEYSQARDEYVKSLTHAPGCHRIPNTAERLPQLTEAFVDQSTESFNNDCEYRSAHIENLLEAAKTYEMFRPRKCQEAIDVYARILRLDDKNTEVRLSLCDVLLEMKLYDQCISEATKLDQTENDTILSHAYYRKAVENCSDTEIVQCSRSDIQQESTLANEPCSVPMDPCRPRMCHCKLPEQMDLFLLSAKHGSPDGANRYIQALLSHFLPVHEHYRTSMEMYESLAAIENALKNTAISQSIKSVLELDASGNSLNLVRSSRYRMTLSQTDRRMDELSAVATIQESKNALDRIANEFVKLHSEENSARKSKPTQYYFLYLKQNRKSDKLGNATEKDFITSRRLLGEKIEKSWRIRDFIDKFPDLLQFLSYRTPVYCRDYGFVAEFCEKVNVHKHEADITQSTQLYYLAHRAAEFTEEVVLEFSKNMKT